ncbi:uncharacterized protein LOC135157855 [Lytechinus pictus]|uniref:uncharacterized protein LOC135157855 n=1 Tax=Lytechinus pictus TaxID=7653 RepID=UPI0030B9D390
MGEHKPGNNLDDLQSTLNAAAQVGQLDLVQELIGQGAEVNKCDKGLTPLIIASTNGFLDVAKYLNSQGAEVDKGIADSWTPLHCASRNGHLAVCNFLISQGADLNVRTSGGHTPLHLAAWSGHFDVTKELIKQGAEVNKDDNEGETPLHIASKNERLDIIQELVTGGAEVNNQGNDARTPIHLSSLYGNLEVTKYLISQGAEVNRRKGDRRSPLYCAAQNGHLAVTKFLLDQGAEVNDGLYDGTTPLQAAVKIGHIDVAIELISHGAGDGLVDVLKFLLSQGALEDNHGHTLLQLAAQSGHLDVTKELIRQGADVNKDNDTESTPLFLASRNGFLDIAKYLICHGAEVDKGNVNIWTPLHVASRNGHLDVIKFLIRKGADLNRGTSGGHTPLHLSVWGGHFDVTKELIEQGAEVNKADSTGETPLHLAAQNEQLDVIQELVTGGAEVDNHRKDGRTPIHITSLNGHLEVTKYLISQGADVNEADNDGQTPSHLASENGHLEIIQLLIREGADLDKNKADGVTPLHLAVINNNFEIVNFLINHGANVNKVIKSGQTPLHIASENGHLEITQLLISEGADVHYINKSDGETALFSAVCEGHLNVTRYLIKQGAKLDVTENHVNYTPLHRAVYAGHCDVAKLLISEGADIDIAAGYGLTALHLAAMNGNFDMTKFLIGQGADIDKAYSGGWLALDLAAAAGHVRVSRTLLHRRAELTGENTGANLNLWTELHSVAERGDLDAMEGLVSQGAKVDSPGSFGWTALHIAASNGHLDMLTYLLGQGAEVNSGNAFGRCALLNAADNGHLNVIEYLISKGADVNKGSCCEMNALHFASNVGNLDIVKTLIGHGMGVDDCDAFGATSLHIALYAGHIDTAKYLLSQGAQLNKRSVCDSVVVQFDGQYSHYDVCRFGKSHVGHKGSGMLEALTVFKGAPEKDLCASKYHDHQEDKQTEGGMHIEHLKVCYSDLDIPSLVLNEVGDQTSLQYAVEGGHLEAVQFLVCQAVDVNESNKLGWTALHTAAQTGRLDIADYLLEQGAKVTTTDVDGISPLHVAAFIGHRDVTEKFLMQGAEVDAPTKVKGSRALHVGVQNGHLNIVKDLLSHGADIDAGDSGGWTALHIAAQNGHIDILKFLLQHLADVRKVTSKGSSALHLSAANGHDEVSRYLLEHGAEVKKIKPDGPTALLASESDQLSGTGPDAGCADEQKKLPPSNGHADTEGITGQGKQVVQHQAEKGCTAVYLATKYGYTTVVETLVAHGADLNVQSIDGQTCLHEAVRLAGQKNSKVEETAALKQISDEFYQSELSPRRALVFYLLDHGAEPSTKDIQGNLPVHYAKDEIVRQMIFSRSPEIDVITAYRAEESVAQVAHEVSADVGYDGKVLELEHHCIVMVVPPGAIEPNTSCKITLCLVRDLPSVDIQDDTSVAAYGIRCDPPSVVFRQPVKIRIPHFTLITNPDQVTPDIVSHVWDAKKGLPRLSRTKSSPSPDKLPHCMVLEKHLELYINHCAEWWVLIPLEQQVVHLQLLCTPYVPDQIERGKGFDVHLYLNADIPGVDMEVEKEEKQRGYHRAHRPFPVSVDARSGDLSVTFDCEPEINQTKLLLLKEIHSGIRHCLSLPVSSSEEGADFSVINVMISQGRRLGMSRSLAFLVRCTDNSGAESTEPVSFIRAVEEASDSALPDIDIVTIAQLMTVNEFYDLGVALGFTIQQLDVFEYRRFRDRQQAIYDMLVAWRKRQTSGREAKETFLSLMKSLETPLKPSDISAATGEVPDKMLLALARRIKAEEFFEIGKKLGFNLTELQHIQHRTCANRKDANIQMLSSWKASQPSGPEAIAALKLVWKSTQAASKSVKSEDEETLREKMPNVTTKRVGKHPPTDKTEAEFVEIIRITDLDQLNSKDDISKSGGSPTTQELCNVAMAVKGLPVAWELGRALCLEDDVVAGFLELPDPSALSDTARRLVEESLNGLDRMGRGTKRTELLKEYNLHQSPKDEALEDLYKKISSMSDLLHLASYLGFGSADIMHIICRTVTLPMHVVRPVVHQMLMEWLRRGGTRVRLLEIVLAFHFNDAAESIAATIKVDPIFVELISSSILDHRGGVVELDELGVRVSIPSGALHRGMRSVVTIRVPSEGAARVPLREGEVLITPVVECSLTQELLNPATVVLPHCIGPKQRREGSGMILYTKTGIGSFNRRRLLLHSSKGFQFTKDKVEFTTNHIQLWALASTNLVGVQFRYAAFQPIIMPSSRKAVLRVYVIHPYKRCIKDIEGEEEQLAEPFCPVTKATNFSLESTTMDISICFSDGFKDQQKAISVKNLLEEESNILSFELEFSPCEDGKKSFCFSIQQGSSTLAEQNLITSIEVEPDYGVHVTDEQGHQHYASDTQLKTLTNILSVPNEVQGLGYQLGFTHTAIEQFLNRRDATFNSVSKSGFEEMLRDWRRRNRPGDQVDKLRSAMTAAGLESAADVFLRGRESSVKFAQLRRAIQGKI